MKQLYFGDSLDVLKAAEWSEQWKGFFNCANTERYKKRYEEIAEKLEKKVEELELN